MTIDLGPELEAALAVVSERSGKTREELILQILHRQLLGKARSSPPRDEFERLLREVGTPCGVILSDEALSREAIYD